MKTTRWNILLSFSQRVVSLWHRLIPLNAPRNNSTGSTHCGCSRWLQNKVKALWFIMQVSLREIRVCVGVDKSSGAVMCSVFRFSLIPSILLMSQWCSAQPIRPRRSQTVDQHKLAPFEIQFLRLFLIVMSDFTRQTSSIDAVSWNPLFKAVD